MNRAPSRSRTTIDDVAKHAGVSTATVSRVINETGAVAPQTAERVYQAITELNYVPHASARELAGGRPNTVGLIFPSISDTFISGLLRGIEYCLSENEYQLLLYSTQGRNGDRHKFYLPLGEHNTDGLIIFANSLSDEELARLHARHFPLVLLHQSPPVGLHIPCVTFENKDGARKMVEHLIACGHRRIALLRGPEDNEDAYWREMGYREAVAAHDIPYRPELVAQGDFSDAVAEAAVRRWLQDNVETDAIFACDDKSARGAIFALHQGGKRIPDDIAVAGFDDARYSRYLTPPLTTIHAPIEEAGHKAAEQLIRLINSEPADPLTLLPTTLVIRESCGWNRRAAPTQD